MKKVNSLFLVDGSNFYRKLKSLNFKSTKKGERLYRKQQSMLANLKKQKVRYFLGYLLKSDGHYHEKGVDVKLAVDMVVTAYNKKAQKIFLLSSDTDIMPAIKVARSKGVKIIYVGFKHQVSKALIHACSRHILLTKHDLKGMFL